MRREIADSYPISVFIAGDIERAKLSCRELCDGLGFCVTLTPTTYIYTGGEEAGMIVGIINYPRFPSDQETLRDRAVVFAEKLRADLDQRSYTIQAPDGSVWISYRDEDQNP